MQVQISLYGKDRTTLHAYGMVELTKIETSSIVERNGRYYVYTPSLLIGSALFVETDIPYRITEF